jgi:Tol biopolymer transport system component
MQSDGTHRRQRTSGPERDIGPVWSPDGTRLTFWSWPPPEASDGQTPDFVAPATEDGRGSLVVIDADGSHPRILADSLSVPAVDLEPAWDPDGGRIAFAHRTDGREVIDLVSTESGTTTFLTEGGTPRWAPDGSLIAYRDPAFPSGVMVIPPMGGEPHRITQATGSGGAFYLPSWSPDSRQVVYYTRDDGVHDISVVGADGSDEHAISTDLLDEYWPAWSPTGDRIAFSRVMSSSNRPHFVVMDPDGADEVVLGRDDDPNFGGASPVWSPDGRYLLGGVYLDDLGTVSDCAPVPPCATLELHVIDTTETEPVRPIPIAENFWNVAWQRVAD